MTHCYCCKKPIYGEIHESHRDGDLVFMNVPQCMNLSCWSDGLKVRDNEIKALRSMLETYKKGKK
jgi:hypothetical protein